MIKKIFPFVLGFIIIFSPVLSLEAKGLVPDCNTGETVFVPKHTETQTIDGVTTTVTVPDSYQYKEKCDFNMVMTLINTIINFVLVDLATPLFVLILIYVGWLYLSDMGSAENVTKSKKILSNALIGYVIALAAWIIVKTILSTLGFNGPLFLG